jgi:hypothetical protein
MNRIILSMQLPVKLRYSEWWFDNLPLEFKKYFDEVIILGQDYIKNKTYRNETSNLFSPIKEAIIFEQEQIKDFLKLEIKDDDVLWVSDISFPGFFTNILYHKPIKHAYCYCHATSRNYLDYFEPFRYSKFDCESGHAKLFKRVFIGSVYHGCKLKWDNTMVVGLPFPPYKTFKEEKIYDIISVARPNNQKVSLHIEEPVEKNFGKIIRKDCNNWEEYYKFLSQGKVLLISSKEDTFNYSIMEAVMNHTVVFAPNKLCFPELLPKKFLYDSYEELEVKLNRVLKYPEDYKPLDKLLCNDLCEKFYENIVEVMKDGFKFKNPPRI